VTLTTAMTMPVAAFRVSPYADADREGVLDLICTIQRGEFQIPITAEDQPDLLDVPGFYRRGCGNFWVARAGDGVRGGVVMEGRDIGTVVLPHAPVKIFLTASAQERARRRTLELEQKGTPQPLEQVLAEIQERDHRDSTRADSPLKPAPGSITVTTDGMTIDQVVDEIAGIANQRQ